MDVFAVVDVDGSGEVASQCDLHQSRFQSKHGKRPQAYAQSCKLNDHNAEIEPGEERENIGASHLLQNCELRGVVAES